LPSRKSGPLVAFQEVGAVAAVHLVVAREFAGEVAVFREFVGAIAAPVGVVALFALQVVVEDTAADLVFAFPGQHVVEASEGHDAVFLGGAGDIVVTEGAPALAGVGVLVPYAVALHRERVGDPAHQQHRGCHRRHQQHQFSTHRYILP